VWFSERVPGWAEKKNFMGMIQHDPTMCKKCGNQKPILGDTMRYPKMYFKIAIENGPSYR
jgi:hypothetical protein